MKTENIFTRNAAFQKFEVLKSNRNKRFRYGQFFVEGVRNINEAIKNGWVISSFIYSDEKPLSSWADGVLKLVETEVNYCLPAGLMSELSRKEDTSELIAIMKMREDDFSKIGLSENPLIALFDRPSNHGNLGTVIRSCDAFGIDCLIITGHAVDLYDPEVISASMGSFFKVPVIRIPDNNTVFTVIDSMKKRYPGFQAVGTTSHRMKNISEVDLTAPSMFLIGNETDGLTQAFKDRSDILATIPMSENSSASSFNVGCASTVMFYEAVRQREIKCEIKLDYGII